MIRTELLAVIKVVSSLYCMSKHVASHRYCRGSSRVVAVEWYSKFVYTLIITLYELLYLLLFARRLRQPLKPQLLRYTDNIQYERAYS